MWFKTTGTAVQPLLGYQKVSIRGELLGGMPVLYVGSDGK
jgi:hypothetical protein